MSIKKNKSGQVMIINLLVLVMTIAVLVALASPINAFLNIAKQSDTLNCAGYVHNGDATNALSYNASLNTQTLACLSLGLYLPYIILVVLVMGVAALGTNRLFGGQSA